MKTYTALLNTNLTNSLYFAEMKMKKSINGRAKYFFFLYVWLKSLKCTQTNKQNTTESFYYCINSCNNEFGRPSCMERVSSTVSVWSSAV